MGPTRHVKRHRKHGRNMIDKHMSVKVVEKDEKKIIGTQIIQTLVIDTGITGHLNTHIYNPKKKTTFRQKKNQKKRKIVGRNKVNKIHSLTLI